MTGTNAPPFVAIELKNTHHILGLLSRDADTSGGNDITLLAPRSLSVRAPISDPVPNSAVAPFALHVQRNLLQATSVSGSTFSQRDQAFSKPLECVLANGVVVPIAVGSAAPAFTFNPSAGGVVAAFDVSLPASVGASAVPYSVIIEEANPAADTDPFVRITESKIPARRKSENAVQIRSAAGNGPPNPLPVNTWVYVLVAISGRPLTLITRRTPP